MPIEPLVDGTPEFRSAMWVALTLIARTHERHGDIVFAQETRDHRWSECPHGPGEVTE